MSNERSVQALTEALKQVNVSITNIIAFTREEFTPVVQKFRKVWDTVVEEVQAEAEAEQDQVPDQTEDPDGFIGKVEHYLRTGNYPYQWSYDQWQARDVK